MVSAPDGSSDQGNLNNTVLGQAFISPEETAEHQGSDFPRMPQVESDRSWTLAPELFPFYQPEASRVSESLRKKAWEGALPGGAAGGFRSGLSKSSDFI